MAFTKLRSALATPSFWKITILALVALGLVNLVAWADGMPFLESCTQTSNYQSSGNAWTPSERQCTKDLKLGYTIAGLILTTLAFGLGFIRIKSSKIAGVEFQVDQATESRTRIFVAGKHRQK